MKTTDFLHSARVVYYEKAFEKGGFITGLGRKKIKNKADGWGFTIFTIEVNGKTCNCN